MTDAELNAYEAALIRMTCGDKAILTQLDRQERGRRLVPAADEAELVSPLAGAITERLILC